MRGACMLTRRQAPKADTLVEGSKLKQVAVAVTGGCESPGLQGLPGGLGSAP
jgi:hypothetical protein